LTFAFGHPVKRYGVRATAYERRNPGRQPLKSIRHILIYVKFFSADLKIRRPENGAPELLLSRLGFEPRTPGLKGRCSDRAELAAPVGLFYNKYC
jgi:hypothetical protein